MRATSKKIEDKLTIYIKPPVVSVSGSVPDGLQKQLKPKKGLGLGKIGGSSRYWIDPNDLVFITLENVEDWFIKYRIYDPLTNIVHWNKKPMPRFEDPAFVPLLEAVVSKTVEDWKRHQEIIRQKKEEEEKKKCEEPSSS
jgi:hypothetical protein